MKKQCMTIISFFLALCAVFAAASCGGKFPAGGTASPKAGQSGGGVRESQPVPAGDWKTPYAVMVNITTVKSAGNDVVYEAGDDETNNPWIRAWKKDLGVDVTYDWIDVGGAQYNTKLNMAIASKTLPDVFKCNYIQFRQLMQAGLLMDITEPYQKYTSQRIRDYEKTDPDTIKTAMVNGKIYGVPNYYYGVIRGSGLIPRSSAPAQIMQRLQKFGVKPDGIINFLTTEPPFDPMQR